MQLTAQEIALLIYVMRYLPEMTQGVTNTGVQIEVPKSRQFSDEELSIALPIFSKLKKCVDNEKYVDSVVEFGSEEKVFLLKLIIRPWSLEDGEVQMSLKDKLKK